MVACIVAERSAQREPFGYHRPSMSPSLRRITIIAGALALIATTATSTRRARADQRAENAAAAEALFNEGRAMMTSGNYAEGCPKLKASYKLDPALGALLNLGECYEKAGFTASAWATFRDAIEEAHRQKRQDRAATAELRANALEPKLSYLQLVGRVPSGARLLKNGAEVDPAILGAKIPVDPGTYALELVGSSIATWKTTARVSGPGLTRIVIPDSTAPSTATPATASTASTASASVAADSGGGGSALGGFQIAGIVTGALGVVGVGVGTYFALDASSLKSKSGCDTTCTTSGSRTLDDARSSANLATVSFIAGGTLLAGGVLLFVLGPRPGPDGSDAKSSTSASITPLVGPTHVGLAGVF